MEMLINILKKETETLKIQYIQKSKEWAEKNYNNSLEISKWNTEKWCEYFSLQPVYKRNGYFFPAGFYNTRNSKTMRQMQEKASKTCRFSLQGYINETEKDAIIHYEQSIEKLAFRIKEKGLNVDLLTVKTAHVGVNIETVLTDGQKTVRAFTILAWGEIQRPHYRYLIK